MLILEKFIISAINAMLLWVLKTLKFKKYYKQTYENKYKYFDDMNNFLGMWLPWNLKHYSLLQTTHTHTNAQAACTFKYIPGIGNL